MRLIRSRTIELKMRSGGPMVAALILAAAILGLSMPSAGRADGQAEAASSFDACRRHGEQHRPRWHPGPTTEPWQWQLQGTIGTTVPACVYDVDGFETSKQTVAKLHREHVKVICYLDVGSWEPYRPDKAEFPRSVIGRRYAGFENERWLDVAHFHRRGMSVALKNDGRQAEELSGSFDFAVVEQCFQYHECGYYKNTFIDEGKAVFEAEYEQKPREYCKTARAIDSARSTSPTTCSPSRGSPAKGDGLSGRRRGRGAGRAGRL